MLLATMFIEVLHNLLAVFWLWLFGGGEPVKEVRPLAARLRASQTSEREGGS
jgi:hypothetical protein